jgi:DNA-binding MarR family transcriptional regulator
LDSSIITYLGQTTRLVGLQVLDHFQSNEIDLNKEQWLVLKKLHEQNGQIQNDLAYITDRSKTSLTRLLNTMEKKDLVCRKNCNKDQRVNHVYYTKKGAELYQRSLPLFNAVIEDLTQGIPEEEIDLAISILKKIKQNAQNKLNDIKI